MKKVCLLIFCLLFVQNIWGQRTREALSNDEQKISDELKKDKVYVQLSCERRLSSANPDRDTSYRLKAIAAFKEEGEKLKLKKTCGTIEGDPIFSYLTIEKGKAQFFIDTSQDDFGQKRVYSYQCSKLDIGIYFNDLKVGRMVFEKIESSEEKDHQIVLRCLADSKEFIF
jgi:Domain of unknown function (DUF4362)